MRSSIRRVYRGKSGIWSTGRSHREGHATGYSPGFSERPSGNELRRSTPRTRDGAFGCWLSRSKVVPHDHDLRLAAEALNAGKKVAILVGAGALHATDEVIAVAEKLGAGVAKALLGKAVLPDELPWVTGSIGMLGTKPSWDMM